MDRISLLVALLLWDQIQVCVNSHFITFSSLYDISSCPRALYYIYIYFLISLFFSNLQISLFFLLPTCREILFRIVKKIVVQILFSFLSFMAPVVRFLSFNAI